MTVKELTQILEMVPDDFEIVLSSDAEGNSFSPLVDHCMALFLPESYEVLMLDEIDPDDGCDKLNCLVLWPE